MTAAFACESENEKEDDFQPTKKRHPKPSAPKGKQRSKLKRYRWRYSEDTVGSFDVQWIALRAKSDSTKS